MQKIKTLAMMSQYLMSNKNKYLSPLGFNIDNMPNKLLTFCKLYSKPIYFLIILCYNIYNKIK